MSFRDEPHLAKQRLQLIAAGLLGHGYRQQTPSERAPSCFEKGEARLWVGLSDDWACFTKPVADRPDRARCKQALLQTRSGYLWKYALDAKGRLLLQSELPVEDIDRGRLPLLLGALDELESPGQSDARDVPDDVDVLPEQEVIACFSAAFHHGWYLKERLRTNHFRALFVRQGCDFEVFLSLNQTFGYFQAPMLQEAGAAAHSDEEACLHHYLLRLNETVFWAKFGVDEDGQVLLLLDFPIEALNRPYHLLATKVLGYYMLETYSEVLIMGNLTRESMIQDLLVQSQRSLM